MTMTQVACNIIQHWLLSVLFKVFRCLTPGSLLGERGDSQRHHQTQEDRGHWWLLLRRRHEKGVGLQRDFWLHVWKCILQFQEKNANSKCICLVVLASSKGPRRESQEAGYRQQACQVWSACGVGFICEHRCAFDHRHNPSNKGCRPLKYIAFLRCPFAVVLEPKKG